jgi:hypothetical protein
MGQKSGTLMNMPKMNKLLRSISGSLPCSARHRKDVLQCFPKFCDKGFGTIALPQDASTGGFFPAQPSFDDF